MNELEQLKREVAELKLQLQRFMRNDRYVLDRDLVFGEAGRIMFQFADPTDRQDVSGSGGVAMTTGIRFNGNLGSDYYSVGDIVYALKLCGILKNE